MKHKTNDIRYELNKIDDNVFEVDFINQNSHSTITKKQSIFKEYFEKIKLFISNDNTNPITQNNKNKIIFGLGGFGVNFINHIKDIDKTKFELVMISNEEVLNENECENKILIDSDMIENIKELGRDTAEVIILNGLGGESSSYLISIIDTLLEFKIKVNIICIKPFKWEGDRVEISISTINKLELLDINLKIYENDKIREYFNDDENIEKGFDKHFDVIYENILKNN